MAGEKYIQAGNTSYNKLLPPAIYYKQLQIWCTQIWRIHFSLFTGNETQDKHIQTLKNRATYTFKADAFNL